MSDKINRGLLEKEEEILDLLKQYSEGILAIVLRNFNRIDEIYVIGIKNIPKGKSEQGGFEEFRAYVNRADIRKFLPEEIFKESINQSGLIDFKLFLKIGQKISNFLKRELEVTRMYGSGKPDEASFDDYSFIPE